MDPIEEPVTEKSKEDSTTEKPKKNTIPTDSKEDLVTDNLKERSITEDPKRTLSLRTFRSFRNLIDVYSTKKLL